MKKIFLYSCLYLLINILLMPINAPYVYSQYGNGDHDFEYENLGAYKGAAYLGALRNASGNVSQIILGDFEPYFSRQPKTHRKEDTKITLKVLSFRISEANGLRPTDIKNIKLILDKNNNKKLDSEDELIANAEQLVPIEIEKDDQGNIWIKKGIITFKQNIVVPENKLVEHFNLMLIADLYDLEPGDKFTISLDKKGIEDYEVPSGAKDVNIYVDLKFKHHVGNRAPVLEFPLVSSEYENLEGTEFKFEVSYSDADNDPPIQALLKIDEDGNGKYKEYKMERSSLGEVRSWIYEERFKIVLRLKFTGNPIKFMFAFFDGEKLAVGDANKEQSISVMPRVFIPPDSIEIRPSKILPGQKTRLFAGVIRHLDSEIDWLSIEGKEFSGVRIEKVILGRRSVSADSKTFEIINPLIIIISPIGTDFGIRKINSLKFPFSAKLYEDEENAVFEKEILIPEFEFELVPIIAESKISKNEAVLGQSIDYSLHFLLFSGTEIKTDISSFTLRPFKKLAQEPKIETNQKDNIIEKIYTFSTWIYDMPIKEEEKFSYSFPPFEIEAEYQEKIFKIKIPPKRVWFVPPLSKQDLSNSLPVDFQEIQPINKQDYFNFFTVPVIGGVVLLFCFASMLIVSWMHREKRFEARERKRKFEHAFVSLLKNLNNWTALYHTEKRKGMVSNAMILLANIQKFFKFLFISKEKQIDLKTKSIQFLIDLLEKDQTIWSSKEKNVWKELLSRLNYAIYNDSDDKAFYLEIDRCKAASESLSSILKERKDTLNKIIAL